MNSVNITPKASLRKKRPKRRDGEAQSSAKRRTAKVTPSPYSSAVESSSTVAVAPSTPAVPHDNDPLALEKVVQTPAAAVGGRGEAGGEALRGYLAKIAKTQAVELDDTNVLHWIRQAPANLSPPIVFTHCFG